MWCDTRAQKIARTSNLGDRLLQFIRLSSPTHTPRQVEREHRRQEAREASRRRVEDALKEKEELIKVRRWGGD